jgi:integrase
MCNPVSWPFLECTCDASGLGRDRTGDLTIFSRSLVPTELPSQTRFRYRPLKKYDTKTFATRTGLEPATSAVTGRRANQLRYRALKLSI